MFKLYKYNVSYFIGLSLFIKLFDLVIVKSALFKENDQLLTIGVTLDFVVVIPLLLYFLIYRLFTMHLSFTTLYFLGEESRIYKLVLLRLVIIPIQAGLQQY